MSYDFAVLVPEAVGDSVSATLADPEVVVTHLWHWLPDDPDFGNGLTFSQV